MGDSLRAAADAWDAACVAGTEIGAGQGRIISAMVRGVRTPTDLVAALGVDASTVSVALRSLVSRGYVERLPYARDRRRYEVILTSDGQVLAALLAKASEQSWRELAGSGFGEAEARRLRVALSALSAALVTSGETMEREDRDRSDRA